MPSRLAEGEGTKTMCLVKFILVYIGTIWLTVHYGFRFMAFCTFSEAQVFDRRCQELNWVLQRFDSFLSSRILLEMFAWNGCPVLWHNLGLVKLLARWPTDFA